MEQLEGHVLEILQRLSAIEADLRHGNPICPLHDQRLGDIEKDVESLKLQQGKQNLIAMTLGAIGAAIILTLKYITGRT